MFIRFVVPSRHEDSHCLTGIFFAACGLCDGRRLSEDEQERCDEILCWFNRNLPIPGQFSRSKKRDACGKAVCWFKDSAALFIRRMRELAVMLEQHNICVEMLRTVKPGYIVYEDPYQIVAIPFRTTRF